MHRHIAWDFLCLLFMLVFPALIRIDTIIVTSTSMKISQWIKDKHTILIEFLFTLIVVIMHYVTIDQQLSALQR